MSWRIFRPASRGTQHAVSKEKVKAHAPMRFNNFLLGRDKRNTAIARVAAIVLIAAQGLIFAFGPNLELLKADPQCFKIATHSMRTFIAQGQIVFLRATFIGMSL
jgi:hypothetical protein